MASPISWLLRFHGFSDFSAFTQFGHPLLSMPSSPIPPHPQFVPFNGVPWSTGVFCSRLRLSSLFSEIMGTSIGVTPEGKKIFRPFSNTSVLVALHIPRRSFQPAAFAGATLASRQLLSSLSSLLSRSFLFQFGTWCLHDVYDVMSAEKSEISKLHTATEETAKVVQELKDELSRIKSLQGFKLRGCAAICEKSSGKSGQIDHNRSEMASRESLDIKSGNDGEYASSVLTEEPEQEAVEMEQLEMELESELQKLNLAETSEVMEECKNLVNGSVSYQYGGISALELDKKLSRLFIEQQEVQINELEAELQTTQSKLQEKEAELQALKVCVRRLTEFLVLDHSDDEHEQDLNQDLSVSWNQHNQTDNEERKPTIGMKRPLE